MGQALIGAVETFYQMMNYHCNGHQNEHKGLLHLALVEVVILLRFP